jgi:hypothetical protein
MCLPARADGAFAFTRIADTSTPVPGRPGNFFTDFVPSPNGDGEVAFRGRSPDVTSPFRWDGLYLYSGGSLSMIADKSTTLPEGTQTFQAVTFNGLLPFDGDTVAFGGYGGFGGPDSSDERGIYQFTGGTLSKVVDRNTPVPDDPLSRFFPIQAGQPASPYLSNGYLAFTNRGDPDALSYYAAYLAIGGTLQTVADRYTPVPGETVNFTRAFACGVDRDGTVLFEGNYGAWPDETRALFTRKGTEFSRILDTSTPIPEGSGTFTGLCGHIDNGEIVLLGYSSSGYPGSGIYKYSAGALTKIIDSTDPVPGIPGARFGGLSCCPAFNNVSFHSGHTVFEAFVDPDDVDDNENEYVALFTDLGGTMTKLLGTDDPLDGKIVWGPNIGYDPIRGEEIAFQVLFRDESKAIYLVRLVPPPPLDVSVDIKPGELLNTVNPKSRGTIAVAILTTPGFDATRVDPLSVAFGPAGATEAHGRGHSEDVDGDGDLDLLLHFRTQHTGIACGNTEATLAGQTFDGQSIVGSDSIVTVGCR